MTVKSLLARLASPLREFGWVAGCLYLLDRAMRRISPELGLYVYEFMVQPIQAEPLLSANLSKNLSSRFILEGDAEVAQMPAREDIKALRFQRENCCLGAFRKGELLGYLWYATDRYEEDEVRCNYVLADKTATIFDFDFYVFPKYRMGIGFMGVWHEANAVLAERGIRYTFSRMTRFNLASRRAHARLGARRIGRAIFCRAWSVEMMVGTLPPFIAMAPTARQRITLTLRGQ